MSEPAFDFKLFNASFEKAFGKDALVDLKAQPEKGQPGTFLPTASESLNFALGIGGLPLGRIVEIFGPESSGKSTLALDVLVQAQRMFPKRPVGYLDVENAVNREYAEQIGLDLSPKRFYFAQEMETQKVLDMAYTMAKAGFAAVVIDSVAGLIPKAQFEEQDTTDAKMGGNSKFMSTHLPFMANACASTGCLTIYLNQVREKIGVMFGNPETTMGGRALPFWASVRCRTQIIEQLKDKEGQPKGARVRAKIIKNKVGAPYRQAEYDLIYGKGIDRIGDLIDVATQRGILEKSGSWFVLDGNRLANGKDAMRTKVAEDEKFLKVLTDTIWASAAA